MAHYPADITTLRREYLATATLCRVNAHSIPYHLALLHENDIKGAPFRPARRAEGAESPRLRYLGNAFSLFLVRNEGALRKAEH